MNELPPLSRPLRLFYAAGPGDIASTFRHWQAGNDDPAEVAVTYSSQFFDLCREMGAEGFAVSSHLRPERIQAGHYRVEHRNIPFARSTVPLYHLGQLLSGIELIRLAKSWRADAAIVSGGTFWFMWAILAMSGVAVIPTLHCTLWRKSRPPRGANCLIHWANGKFFRNSARAILSLSDDISGQVKTLTSHSHPPIHPFLPVYRRDAVAMSPPKDAPPFRILFAGRIERNKGVFDLLEVCRRIHAAGRFQIEFDLCGSGSAMDELRATATQLGLAQQFRFHGHQSQSQMRERFASAHAVVVPTTSDFIEGFNKVVAEAVLCGRPVVTSDVCPAINYVRPAVVEVNADDIEGYRAAIERLCDDREFYLSKANACAALREQFLDPSRSWKAALKAALDQESARS